MGFSAYEGLNHYRYNLIMSITPELLSHSFYCGSFILFPFRAAINKVLVK